ncbi:TolC family protein [uncultured Dokdonia sp.]|uniref:TolC family protein n=1 Tax=uncultured Dokdonia sp. TaxID=575653 RepID=UPI0026170E63|nr:TolC family protein [uncultured Dokdonia sp.]
MKFTPFFLILFISATIFGQSREVTIGILADKIVPEHLPLLEQLKSEIRAVAGQNVQISFKDVEENGFAFAKAASTYNALVTDDTDIILAFGAINAVMLSQRSSYPKPTIVFGDINKDLVPLALERTTSQINNISYVITSKSYIDDLKAFQELYDFKNIGILVDQHQIDVLKVQEVFTTYFQDKEASYTLIPISSTVNLNGIDAVYLADGGYLNGTNRKELITSINQAGLPSFSSHSYTDIENGILATQATNSGIDQFFRRMALNIEDILNGTNPSELPQLLTLANEMTINYDTAKEIQFPLRYSFLATTNFIGGGVVSTTEGAYSLKDIMTQTITENLGLRSSKKAIDLAQQDVKTAKSNFLPNVSANATGLYVDPKVAEISGGAQPEISTSTSVGVDQLIYSESAAAGIDIQKNLQKAEQENYNAAELDALLNAAVAYFNALILKTNTGIQNENLKLTKLNLKIAEQNYEAGETGKSDVLRLRSQLAQNTQALIEAGNSLQQGFNMINQLLNDKISNEIDIQNAAIEEGLFEDYKYDDLRDILDNPKLRPAFIDFLVEEAKKNAPELKSIGYNANVLDRNYDLNDWGRYIPTVALSGQYSLALSQSGAGSTIPAGVPTAPDGTYNVGLNLSLPIFQQNQRNINRQTIQIQQEQLQLQKENVDLNIEQSVNDIVLDMISQIANIEISQVSEENAKESLELTQNEYAEGAVPIIQLIDAQNNYLQAQLSRATANYNYLLISMQLERAIGYFFLMNTEASNQDFIQRAQQYILNRN